MVRRQRKIKEENEDDEVVVVDGSSDEGDHAISEVDVVASGNIGERQGGSSENDNNDDDDEIVREIPVFLSPELSNQIQLVQFPLQISKSQVHPSGPDAVRVKPRHCMMEIDFATPGNIHYDGLYSMPSRTFKSQIIPVSTHMALGKMIEVEAAGNKTMGLHLVPLSKMTQMRPSFSHIDEAAETSSATTEADLKQQEAQNKNSSDRKSVTFRKKESERQELARKSSYGYKKASEDAEGWHSLEIYDDASLQANLIMDKVACPEEHQTNNLLDVEGLEKASTSAINKKIQGTSLNVAYLNTLDYLPLREDVATDQSMEKLDIDNQESEDNLALVVAKLVKLMRLGMPIPFSLLRAEFPPASSKGDGISDTALCVALGSCAVLVRGNWCLNSKLLSYPRAMTQARTFLLCLFQSMRVVHRERLMKVFEDNIIEKTSAEDDEHDDDDKRVTSEVIEMLLEQLGEKTIEGWVLKVADDLRFAEEHPQTTLVHLQYWGRQIELFQPMIEKYRSDFCLKEE